MTSPSPRHVVSAALLSLYLGILFGYPSAAVHSPKGVAPDFGLWVALAFGFGTGMTVYSWLPKPKALLEANWLVIALMAASISFRCYVENPEGVVDNAGMMFMFVMFTFFVPGFVLLALFFWHFLVCDPRWQVVALAGAGVLATVIALGSQNADRVQEAQKDFKTVCATAGLVVHRRLNRVEGVLLEEIGTREYPHGFNHPPSFQLLEDADIKFVDRVEKSGSYTHSDHPTKFTSVNDSQADVLIRSKTITSPQQMKTGLFGEEMVISDRRSGEQLADLKYYWTTQPPYTECPHPQSGLNPEKIAAYVIGLKDPDKFEAIFRKAWIPNGHD